jgi:hypothetical protein
MIAMESLDGPKGISANGRECSEANGLAPVTQLRRAPLVETCLQSPNASYRPGFDELMI